jgi:hypothetical protein
MPAAANKTLAAADNGKARHAQTCHRLHASACLPRVHSTAAKALGVPLKGPHRSGDLRHWDTGKMLAGLSQFRPNRRILVYIITQLS